MSDEKRGCKSILTINARNLATEKEKAACWGRNARSIGNRIGNLNQKGVEQKEGWGGDGGGGMAGKTIWIDV